MQSFGYFLSGLPQILFQAGLIVFGCHKYLPDMVFHSTQPMVAAIGTKDAAPLAA